MSALRPSGWLLRVLTRSVFALLLVAAMGGMSMVGFLADSSVVDSSGRVIMVEVVSDPENPSDQGLLYSEQNPQGQTQSEPIDFTIDPVLDTSPTVALNPGGGIVVVWSRHDGSDFELMLSRRENGYWTLPRTLTSNVTLDTEARMLVGAQDIAHVLWWGNGEGGPIYLRSFNILTGQPINTRQEPLSSPRGPSRPRSGGTGWDEAGGMDEPGIPSASGNLAATALPCLSNPDAAPAHGVVMACGQPAAYQLSACNLVVGVRDPVTLSWRQTIANLQSAPLGTTSVTSIVQSIAEFNCQLP